MQTPHSRSKAKVAPTHTTREQVEMVSLMTTSLRQNTIREMRRQSRTQENVVSTMKVLSTTLKNVSPRNPSWMR